MENKELIDLMVDYRVQHNISMRELAKRCGVSYNTIHNIETEKCKPLRTVIRKVLKVIKEEEQYETMGD